MSAIVQMQLRSALASQETDTLEPRSGTYTRQDDNLLLLTLKPIDGIEIDSTSDVVAEALPERRTQRLDLFAVRTDESDARGEVYGRELLRQATVQLHGGLHLHRIRR